MSCASNASVVYVAGRQRCMPEKACEVVLCKQNVLGAFRQANTPACQACALCVPLCRGGAGALHARAAQCTASGFLHACRLQGTFALSYRTFRIMPQEAAF